MSSTLKSFVEEFGLLAEKVFDEDKYTWYVWRKVEDVPIQRRGKTIQLKRGDMYGIRRATSSDDKWRLVLKSQGPSIIFSIDRPLANRLKNDGELRESKLTEATFTDDQVDLDDDLIKFCKENVITCQKSGGHGLVKFTGTRTALGRMIDKFWGEPEDYKNMIESQVFESTNLFAKVDEIKIDPDKTDVHDVVRLLLPSLVKMAYTFLHQAKVKHERTAGDDDKFDFSPTALRDEVQQLIDNVKDRMGDLTYKEILEEIESLKSEFKHPLEETA